MQTITTERLEKRFQSVAGLATLDATDRFFFNQTLNHRLREAWESNDWPDLTELIEVNLTTNSVNTITMGSGPYNTGVESTANLGFPLAYEVGTKCVITRDFGQSPRGDIVTIIELRYNELNNVTHPHFQRDENGNTYFTQPSLPGFGQWGFPGNPHPWWTPLIEGITPAELLGRLEPGVVGTRCLITRDFGPARQGDIVTIDEFRYNSQYNVLHPRFMQENGFTFFSQPAVSGFGQHGFVENPYPWWQPMDGSATATEIANQVNTELAGVLDQFSPASVGTEIVNAQVLDVFSHNPFTDSRACHLKFTLMDSHLFVSENYTGKSFFLLRKKPLFEVTETGVVPAMFESFLVSAILADFFRGDRELYDRSVTEEARAQESLLQEIDKVERLSRQSHIPIRTYTSPNYKTYAQI